MVGFVNKLADRLLVVLAGYLNSYFCLSFYFELYDNLVPFVHLYNSSVACRCGQLYMLLPILPQRSAGSLQPQACYEVYIAALNRDRSPMGKVQLWLFTIGLL